MLKKWLVFANFVVIMVIGGYLAYLLSTVIPIPGSKFLIMGPFLTLVLMIPLERYPKLGTLSIINLVFGLVLFMITPWMTLAIVVSGLAADLAMLFPTSHWIKRVVALGVYNTVSFGSTFYITNFITGNHLYVVVGPFMIAGILVLTFLAGVLGALAGRWIHMKYLRKVK